MRGCNLRRIQNTARRFEHRPDRNSRWGVARFKRGCHFVHLLGRFHFRHADRSGPRAGSRLQIVSTPLGSERVNADHDLAPAETPRFHGGGNQFARWNFLVGRDRIFEIENHRIDRQCF